jgi:hypothetical protein
MSIANILNRPVLVLNANWQAISAAKSVKRAIEDMTSGRPEDGWLPPFRGMDVELNADGTLFYANPVDWDEWVRLPVRPGIDEFVSTAFLKIRAPRVIISRNYNKSRVRVVALSKGAIKRRDGGQCQYCHRFFPMDELNIDHVIPQHHGGEDTWENMVCSCITCNSRKGHKFNHEIGYKLLKEPSSPAPVAETAIYIEIKHPTWTPFLNHLK